MAMYAAYGSNLDPARMAKRAPHSPAVGPGWLDGWRLTFGNVERGLDESLPTVVEDATSQVFVMLYELTDNDESSLNSAEGFDLDFYRRIHVRVNTLNGIVTAWLYVVNGYESGLPRQSVVDEIIEALIVAGAPDDYVAMISSQVTFDEEY
jgi:gamma-glutamylcyclotransferase (GGCT)/AIG2-like uncharacterized protein YtfP